VKSTKGIVISSQEVRSDGKPLFTLEAGSDSSRQYIAKVGTFEYLNKVLNVTGEMRLAELQDLIQCNLFISEFE
jgi:hypothetical protein